MPLLSAKPIINWCDVNMYTMGNQWTINSGDPITLYFQIIDTNQAIQGNNAIAFGGYGGYGFASGSAFSGVTGVGTTAGLRYLLGVGSSNQPYSVKVTFPSIDSNQVLSVGAVQVDPSDSSIWSVSVPAIQTIAGGNVKFTVSEGSKIYRFNVINMLDVIFPGSVGGC